MSLDWRHYHALADRAIENCPPYPAGRFSARGIVICGGGERYFTQAWVAINVLRHVGCRLPIELWHLGQAELNDRMRRLVAELGVACIDAHSVFRDYPVRSLYGWQLKPYAMLHSTFQELLYLDADNVVASDPSYLFDLPQYIETGAVFWPDRFMGGACGEQYRTLRPEAWSLCNVPFVDEPEIEAGQLLVDKSRCWAALNLTMHFNELADVYYEQCYGDKDTFHLAWRRLQHDYALVPFSPSNPPHGRMLFQHDFAGRVVFQHRSNLKWSLNEPPRRVPGFLHENVCFESLDRLRQLWSGRVRESEADFTPAEGSVRQELLNQGTYAYCPDRSEVIQIRLIANGTVQRPPRLPVTRWDVEQTATGSVLLRLDSNERTLIYLTKAGGTWVGRELAHGRRNVRVVARRPSSVGTAPSRRSDPKAPKAKPDRPKLVGPPKRSMIAQQQQIKRVLVRHPQSCAQIKIHGLPRSCTNLITLLLFENYFAEVHADNYGWKHGPPVLTAGHAIAGTRVRFVICVKNPYAWLVSLHQYEQRERQYRIPFEEFVVKGCRFYGGRPPLAAYCDMIRQWLGLSRAPSDVQVVKAEDLQNQQVPVLERLEQQFGLERRRPQLRQFQERIGPDETITPTRMDLSWYSQQRYLSFYDTPLLQLVNDCLDRDLMASLGYQMILTAGDRMVDVEHEASASGVGG